MPSRAFWHYARCCRDSCPLRACRECIDRTCENNIHEMQQCQCCGGRRHPGNMPEHGEECQVHRPRIRMLGVVMRRTWERRHEVQRGEQIQEQEISTDAVTAWRAANEPSPEPNREERERALDAPLDEAKQAPVIFSPEYLALSPSYTETSPYSPQGDSSPDSTKDEVRVPGWDDDVEDCDKEGGDEGDEADTIFATKGGDEGDEADTSDEFEDAIHRDFSWPGSDEQAALRAQRLRNSARAVERKEQQRCLDERARTVPRVGVASGTRSQQRQRDQEDPDAEQTAKKQKRE